MAETPELLDVLTRLRDRILESFFVALPGSVTKYDPATQTARIELQVTDPIDGANGKTEYETLPVLSTVPVAFQRGGGMVVQFDPVPGDTGLVLFCGLDFSRWFASGEPGNPRDERRHSTAHPVFLPCLVASSETIGEVSGAVFGEVNGAVVHVGGGVIRIGNSTATERIPLGDTLTSWLAGHTHPGIGAVPTPGVPFDLNLGFHLSEHRVDKG